MNNLYVPIWAKFVFATAMAILWAMFSLWIADRWIVDLGRYIGLVWSYVIIVGIAIIPGFMNAFMVVSLLIDRRPKIDKVLTEYPPITILVAAFNEEDNILSTLESLDKQQYPGEMTVIVIDDGSTDTTVEKLKSVSYPWLKIVEQGVNQGKSAALNAALKLVTTDITLTVDGDSYLFKDALRNIVGRFLSDPEHTAAVAGAPLVRNSRVNLVTRAQEWDYFHGIAAIKRLQSLYQGTMVAQGAFSLYRTDVLREINGWSYAVGEDIVLTWSILAKGYRVGFAENACLFTNAPTTWGQFFKQRQRWSRGLIEGFKSNWRLLFKARYSTMFVWWNLFFPYMDLVYTFVFIPGLVAALFGYYWIAGPMTLLVLPLAMLVNYMMYQTQNKMFIEQGLKVRRNIGGFFFYAFLYSLLLQPVCTIGYIRELYCDCSKHWGTK